MTREVAPGIHRLGNDLVNFYVVEDGTRLALVDAGLPGFAVSSRSSSPGAAARLATSRRCCSRTPTATTSGSPSRCAAGATVYVHEADAEMARTAKPQSREGGMRPYFRHRATWRLLVGGARVGAVDAEDRLGDDVRRGRRARRPRPSEDRPHTGPLGGPRRLPLPRPRRAAGGRRDRHLEPADGPQGAADHPGRVQRLEPDRRWRRWSGSSPWRRVWWPSATAIRGRVGWRRRSRGLVRPGRGEVCGRGPANCAG